MSFWTFLKLFVKEMSKLNFTCIYCTEDRLCRMLCNWACEFIAIQGMCSANFINHILWYPTSQQQNFLRLCKKACLCFFCSKSASLDEEVFFGPVSFKEKCRLQWANDMQAGVEFDEMASRLRVEDWCEIFVNANIVASTLTASAKKRIAEQQRLTERPENEVLISGK